MTALSFALLMVCPKLAWADTGAIINADSLWMAWNIDLLVLFNLSVLGGLYIRGKRRLWKKAGRGRCVTQGQVAAFLSSMLVLLVALVSPLDALSSQLASAHMVQHMLLIVVAAPLFVVGVPGLVVNCGVSGQARRVLVGCRRWLETNPVGQPLLASGLFAMTLWAWHWPAMYQAALADPLVHDAQHLSFFVSACLFWRNHFDPIGKRSLHPVGAVMVLFTTSLHATLLGVFMTLSPVPWYAVYEGRTENWGLTPLEDQQLAGVIMWVPACFIFPGVAAAVFGSWLATYSSPEVGQHRAIAKGA